MYRASCKFITQNKCITYGTYINNILYIVNTATCFDSYASSSGSLILFLLKCYKNHYCYKPAYRKHELMNHTYKTVQTVYTAFQANNFHVL